MGPMLVDTSVWINFFNGINNFQTKTVRECIENDHPFFICPLIIQEILQGIRSDSEYSNVKESLLKIEILTIDPLESAIGAANLFRSLRKKGTTIKKSKDCLIAFYAIYFEINLLHNDKDFELIAKYSDLKTQQS